VIGRTGGEGIEYLLGEAEEAPAGLVVPRLRAALAVEQPFQARRVHRFSVEKDAVEGGELFLPGPICLAIRLLASLVDAHHRCQYNRAPARPAGGASASVRPIIGLNVSREDLDAITAVPGIRVGHWTDAGAATGCTVVLCEGGATGGVDVRGAAPGTRETDALRPGNLVDVVHAVLLAGGSAFGLAAADGVMRFLAERGAGFFYAGRHIPIVPAAILMDLGVGRADAFPGPDEGYRAAQDASDGAVEEGSVGAGTGATIAKTLGMDRALKGGVGTAAERMSGGVIVGALVAVNAAGDIVDPDTGALVAGPRGEPGKFERSLDVIREGRAWRFDQHAAAREHTTLAIVATNARLTKEQANRLATVAHDGMARAIVPVHTMGDGDAVFALATGVVEAGVAGYRAIQALAPRAVERAILRAVRAAAGLAGVPSAEEWRALRRD
jgi:L-aminopeptidase/D-esterase-like protein